MLGSVWVCAGGSVVAAAGGHSLWWGNCCIGIIRVVRGIIL